MKFFQNFFKIFFHEFLPWFRIWLVFGVVCSLLHLWIGFLVYRIYGYPLNYQSLSCGTLFTFAIVLTFQSFGNFCLIAKINIEKSSHFLSICFGGIIVVTSVTLYTLLSVRTIIQIKWVANLKIVIIYSIILAAGAVIYAISLKVQEFIIVRKLLKLQEKISVN